MSEISDFLFKANTEILKNIFTGDYEVYYSGQRKGRMDYKLLNAVNNDDIFYVY